MMIDFRYLSSHSELIHIVHHSGYFMYSAKHLLKSLIPLKDPSTIALRRSEKPSYEI